MTDAEPIRAEKTNLPIVPTWKKRRDGLDDAAENESMLVGFASTESMNDSSLSGAEIFYENLCILSYRP